MQISQLPSNSTLASTDFMVKETNAGVTQKIPASDLVANNLTTTAVGKVLDARQGKALKDLINGLVSTTSVSDLSDIPVNTSGYIGITDASINPKGNTTSMFAYHCFGSNDRRALIAVFTANATPEVYVNTYHNTWRGWKTVTLT